MKLGGWVFAFGWIIALGGVARADLGAEEARFFDEMARRAYEAGRYDEAFEHFVLALESAPSPRTRYNVALSAQLAGRTALAYATFASYLEDDDEDVIRRADATVRMRSLARRLALVHVETQPRGGTIHVDAGPENHGVTPRTIAVAPGSHVLRVRLPGHAPATARVTAIAGTTTEVSLALQVETGVLTLRLGPPAVADHAHVIARAASGEPFDLVPGRGTALPVGTYTVRVEADGFVAAELPVIIAKGAEETREVVLRPVPRAPAAIVVDTHGVPTRVYVDGRLRAIAPGRLVVSPGDHALRFEADGFVTTRRLSLRESEVRVISVRVPGGEAVE